MVNFQDELKKRTEEINKVIQSYLPAEEGFAKTMAQAMNYSILAGGKRLRPMLVLETLRPVSYTHLTLPTIGLV